MASLAPYVMVDDARVFKNFVEQVFGAEVLTVVPLPEDPSRTLHAQARIGDDIFYFADSGPGGMKCLDSPDEPVHIQMWTTVADPDTSFSRAIAAGARPVLEVSELEDGTRSGGFVDPFGTLWWVNSQAQ
ncbi:hypothetical protein ONR57_20920 [Hoyosella sp. YIM 151337]|uniref:VOC family protein n=1 Tax=Hoyosella sp. YIM 151337 TaxID=2992742 RepID=UPI0022363451|nr:hypothetical protein [Hoyosella sp. YIM 151337]MCW4355772.1 hypothetical protein [Hoyosella sp. YIM 151337]